MQTRKPKRDVLMNKHGDGADWFVFDKQTKDSFPADSAEHAKRLLRTIFSETDT